MTRCLTATVKSARWLMLVTGSCILISQSALAQQGAMKPLPTHTAVPYGLHPRNLLDFWQAEGRRPTPLVGKNASPRLAFGGHGLKQAALGLANPAS